MYSIVKQFHVVLAITSVSLFQLRYWYFRVGAHAPPLWAKTMPHIVDTLLLVLGVTLAVMAGFTPLNSPWLLFKLLALLAYICFGMFAMKKSGPWQWINYCMATIAIGYMLFSATYKTPWFL